MTHILTLEEEKQVGRLMLLVDEQIERTQDLVIEPLLNGMMEDNSITTHDAIFVMTQYSVAILGNHLRALDKSGEMADFKKTLTDTIKMLLDYVGVDATITATVVKEPQGGYHA